MSAETPAKGRPPAAVPEKDRSADPVPPTAAPRPWVLGVVGGVASGKSAVAGELVRLADAVLIDGDAVGHEVLRQADIISAVREAFPQLSGHNGEPIDRRELGRIVFSDPAEMTRLESILHPRMRMVFEATTSAAREADRCVVFDAAVLLESGWNDLCDAVVFVDVPEAARKSRALARGWDEQRWQRAEGSQWPVSRKQAAADFSVDNTATPAAAAESALNELSRHVAATSA